MRRVGEIWHLPDDGSGLNPYGALLTRALERAGVSLKAVPYKHVFALDALRERPDALHFEFIAPYLLPALHPRSRLRALVKGPLFLAQIAALRLAGLRITWTIHNLRSHEGQLAGLERVFNTLFTRLASGLITHGDTARESASKAFLLSLGDPRLRMVPHPSYADAYPNTIMRAEARARLGIAPDARVVLGFGLIRRYKGYEELIDAFAALGGEGAEVWIVGRPQDDALDAVLKQRSAEIAGVHYQPGFVPAEETQLYFNACDVVALPYRNILTSGAALVGMAFRRAILAPRLGCLVEVLDDEGALLYDHGAPDGLNQAMRRALAATPEELERMGEHNGDKAASWTWDALAQVIIELCGGH